MERGKWVLSDGGAVQGHCAVLVLGELELLTFVTSPGVITIEITGSEAL